MRGLSLVTGSEFPSVIGHRLLAAVSPPGAEHGLSHVGSAAAKSQPQGTHPGGRGGLMTVPGVGAVWESGGPKSVRGPPGAG